MAWTGSKARRTEGKAGWRLGGRRAGGTAGAGGVSGGLPGLARLQLRLEGVDGVDLLHGQADVVEAVQQAVLAVGVHLEGDASRRPGR